MATRKEFEEALNKIGWSIYHSPNGLNDYIINNKNKETRFLISGEILKIGTDLFGKNGSGTFRWELKDCKIKYYEDAKFVSISPSKEDPVKGGIFISFYGRN